MVVDIEWWLADRLVDNENVHLKDDPKCHFNFELKEEDPRNAFLGV